MSEQENEHNRSIEDFGLDRIVRPAQEVRFTEIEIEEVDTISEAKADLTRKLTEFLERSA